jgi:hypothetical protein
VCVVKNMKNKQKEWHPATKPLKVCIRSKISAKLDGHIIGLKWAKVGIASLHLVHDYE